MLLQSTVTTGMRGQMKSVIVSSSHYLVKWRLDSWTSISLLLKSFSSFLIAACRHEIRKLSKVAMASQKKKKNSLKDLYQTLFLYTCIALFILHSRLWTIPLSSLFTSQDPHIFLLEKIMSPNMISSPLLVNYVCLSKSRDFNRPTINKQF